MPNDSDTVARGIAKGGIGLVIGGASGLVACCLTWILSALAGSYLQELQNFSGPDWGSIACFFPIIPVIFGFVVFGLATWLIASIKKPNA